MINGSGSTGDISKGRLSTSHTSAHGPPFTVFLPFHQSSWDAEMKLHSKNPQLWRAAFKAYFPIQLPLYVPFAIVTAAKIVQAHVGITGLIDVLIYDRGLKKVRGD